MRILIKSPLISQYKHWNCKIFVHLALWLGLHCSVWASDGLAAPKPSKAYANGSLVMDETEDVYFAVPTEDSVCCLVRDPRREFPSPYTFSESLPSAHGQSSATEAASATVALRSQQSPHKIDDVTDKTALRDDTLQRSYITCDGFPPADRSK